MKHQYTIAGLVLVISVLLLSRAVAEQAETSQATSVLFDGANASVTLRGQAMPISFGDYAAEIVGVQYDYAGGVVSGAPYSAVAVTESVQMLHDGNRIRRKNETRLYRDSEGRTRREQRLNTLGAWQLTSAVAPLVFVHDPVQKKSFMLDVGNRVARPLVVPQFAQSWHPQSGSTVAFGSDSTLSVAGASADAFFMSPQTTVSFSMHNLNTVTEELGERDFDGVSATGTRTRLIIDAGTIGNEQPLEVSTESWYSSRLEAVVLRKRTDPRFGEITYRLIDISLDEPDATLFRVPDDYRVVE